MPAPEQLRTERLVLRRPRTDDIDAIFAYASDPIATRYMSWPRHLAREDTEKFLAQAIIEWEEIGIGAYLVTFDGVVLGSTGLHLATNYRGVTGYILRQEAWGKGYATEACRAMVHIARRIGLARIDADCHIDHGASARVLEKSGLLHEGILRAYLQFPNLGGPPADVHLYGLALQRATP